MSVSSLSIAAFETEALPRGRGVVGARVARWVESTVCKPGCGTGGCDGSLGWERLGTAYGPNKTVARSYGRDREVARS